MGEGCLTHSVTRCVLACISAIWLCACATLDVDRGYTLSGKTSEGLVAVSLSYEGLAPGVTPTWYYRRVDGNEQRHLMTTWAWAPLDWTSPPGRLATFVLPPGHYEFYHSKFMRAYGGSPMSWTIGPKGAAIPDPWMAGYNSPSYIEYSARSFSVRFEVRPGKATYVGNLHLVWHELDGQGEVVHRDESTRDLVLLRTRLPAINLEEILLVPMGKHVP